MTRLVDANDLELYAINTGEFYAIHKHLAGKSLNDWMVHVTGVVLPSYCRKVEPVQINNDVLVKVANGLRDYYYRHVSELVTAKLKVVNAPNVAAADPATLTAMQRVLQDAIGVQWVAIVGSLNDGLAAVGPFPDQQSATAFLDASDVEGWVFHLHSPADRVVDAA